MKQVKRKNALYGLLAETSIHAGAGHAAEVIDLPIQREQHTEWPCIFGSAVKGALRTKAESTIKEKDLVAAIFGPSGANAHDFAGALAVCDARLLLLPVRSLTGHFRWVTCPAVLQRFQRDTARLDLGNAARFTLPDPGEEDVIVHDREDCAKDAIYLEEFRYKTKSQDLSQLIKALAALMKLKDAGKHLQRQLAIVHNDRFKELSKFATPVTPHIAIDSKTKTVTSGGLWYEETLPPETLMYLALHAWNVRRKDDDMTAAGVMEALWSGLFGKDTYLQIGGNETLGMGWFAVRQVKAEA